MQQPCDGAQLSRAHQVGQQQSMVSAASAGSIPVRQMSTITEDRQSPSRPGFVLSFQHISCCSRMYLPALLPSLAALPRCWLRATAPCRGCSGPRARHSQLQHPRATTLQLPAPPRNWGLVGDHVAEPHSEEGLVSESFSNPNAPLSLCRHLLDASGAWVKDFCITQSYLKQPSDRLLKGKIINVSTHSSVAQ